MDKYECGNKVAPLQHKCQVWREASMLKGAIQLPLKNLSSNCIISTLFYFFLIFDTSVKQSEASIILKGYINNYWMIVLILAKRGRYTDSYSQPQYGWWWITHTLSAYGLMDPANTKAPPVANLTLIKKTIQ